MLIDYLMKTGGCCDYTKMKQKLNCSGNCYFIVNSFLKHCKYVYGLVKNGKYHPNIWD